MQRGPQRGSAESAQRYSLISNGVQPIMFWHRYPPTSPAFPRLSSVRGEQPAKHDGELSGHPAQGQRRDAK